MTLTRLSPYDGSHLATQVAFLMFKPFNSVSSL